MISDQTALRTQTATAATETRRATIGRPWWAGIGAMVSQVTGAIRRWAKAPLLPYAALWEASVVVGLLKERERVEPER